MGQTKEHLKAKGKRLVRARNKKAELAKERVEVKAVLFQIVQTIAEEFEEDIEIEEEIQFEEITESHNDPSFFDLTDQIDDKTQFLVWNSSAETTFHLRGESLRNLQLKRKQVKDREESACKCRKLDYYYPKASQPSIESTTRLFEILFSFPILY